MTLTAARSDVYMELGINKRHFQTSGFKMEFDHGELSLYVRDGNIGLAACSSDPELYFYGPHIGCTLGITGFVAWGDFNRDGVSDANQYWSIDTVVPAVAIAPSYPQLCELVSAPPSKLPRPLRIFRDGAVTVFHDLRSPQVTQYNIALYDMLRRYGSVRQVETIVTAGSVEEDGTLIVTVTGVDFPAPVDIPVTIDVPTGDLGVEIPVFAEEWAENIRVALRLNPQISAVYSVGGTGTSITLTEIVPNGNDPTLHIQINEGTTTTTDALPLDSRDTVQGVLVGAPALALKQMNEELVNGRYVFAFPSRLNPTTVPVNLAVTIVPNVEASGSNPRSKGGFRFTSGVFDGGYYQMDPRTLSTLTWTGNDPSNVVPGDQLYFSILNEAEDWIQFPPTVPQTPVAMSSPSVQGYTLPPGFFEVGDEGVVDLRYQRSLRVTPVSWDRSKREFRMKVRFVDSYPGYAQSAFPLGTSGDVSVSGDFDRDGMSNIEEYAYEFPTHAEIIAAAKAGLVPTGGTTFIQTQEFDSVDEDQLPEEPISDKDLKPAGPIGPELDAENHVVFKVPYRAHIGTSLKYEFVENTVNKKGKVKSKKIKPGAKWTVGFEDGETWQDDVIVQVRNLDPTTRDVISVGEVEVEDVTVTKRYIVLRSANPVNPADPLPNLGVKLVPVSIN